MHKKAGRQRTGWDLWGVRSRPTALESGGASLFRGRRSRQDSAGAPREGAKAPAGAHELAISAPRCIDTLLPGNQNTRLVFAEGYPSGQREQTVNLPAYAFVGSNPTPSTTRDAETRTVWARGRRVRIGGCSSMVEPQPSKLMTWVRFPLPAPEQFVLADVAQLVEHVLGKDEVTGSIPVVSSSFVLS